VLHTLDESGQAGNTVFAFTSDHGEMAGDHLMLEKRLFYEESARVPFLLRVPWLGEQQQRVRGVCSHVDMVPTLLDLAGHQIPDELPGRSLAGALTGALDLRQHDAFIEWNGISDTPDCVVHDRELGSPQINVANARLWRGVVTGDRWKLNLCAQDDCELFDLANDPHELTNLFGDVGHARRARDLAARIRQWQADSGDSAPLPEF
jgi:arylsulfatase A-like enzyme